MTADLDDFQKNMDEAEGILPDIQRAQEDYTYIDGKFAEGLQLAEEWLKSLDGLQFVADEYSKKIHLIYEASRPLDEHATVAEHLRAKKFAEALLPIITMSTKESYLNDCLPVQAERLLGVMERVAAAE